MATPRFPSPLIKPDVRISRIRLSDQLHRKAHGGRPIQAGISRRHRGPYAPSPCNRACSNAPESQWCFQAHRQSPILCIFPSMPEVRVLCSSGITQHQRSYDPVRLPPGLPCLPRHRSCDLRPKRVSPDYPDHLSDVPCPLPRRIERVLMSIPSPLMQPSPNGRRVGIRIVTFEACSGFTHVTARRIAQPPKATFVTRLQPGRLPDQAARQLPDLSTTIRVEPSSTGDPRLRGALPTRDIGGGLTDTAMWHIAMPVEEPSTASVVDNTYSQY